MRPIGEGSLPAFPLPFSVIQGEGRLKDGLHIQKKVEGQRGKYPRMEAMVDQVLPQREAICGIHSHDERIQG